MLILFMIYVEHPAPVVAESRAGIVLRLSVGYSLNDI